MVIFPIFIIIWYVVFVYNFFRHPEWHGPEMLSMNGEPFYIGRPGCLTIFLGPLFIMIPPITVIALLANLKRPDLRTLLIVYLVSLMIIIAIAT
jgi:hypothetical protein